MRAIMNCEQTRQYLYDYVDGDLESIQQQMLEQHISGCKHCTLLVEQQSKLKTQLQSMTVVEPSSDFEQRIMARLDLERDSERKSESGATNKSGKITMPGFMTQNWFAAAMSGAVTAVALLWFISVNNFSIIPASSTLSVVSIELVPNQLQKVNLAFNSPYEIDKATFNIILPANVEVNGHKGKRELQWVSKLKQGANRLALPLVATRLLTNANSESFITARISHEGKSRDFKIKIISKAQQSSMQRDIPPVFVIT